MKKFSEESTKSLFRQALAFKKQDEFRAFITAAIASMKAAIQHQKES